MGRAITTSAIRVTVRGEDVLGRLRETRARVARAARPGVVARSGGLVWLPVGLSCGIALWFQLRFEPGVPVYAVMLAALMAALAIARYAPHWADAGRIGWDGADRLRWGMMAVAALAAGFLLCGIRLYTVSSPVLNYRYYGVIEGRVEGIDRSSRDRIRITLRDPRLKDVTPQETPRRVRLSLTAPGAQPLPAPGATVRITGHLGPPPGPAEPGGFDFRRGAFFAGLGAIGYSRLPVIELAPSDPGPAEWVASLRLRLGAGMRAAIGGQEGAVAAALMTGDRSGIHETTNQLMRDANLYHIVSISGLHMSMLAGFIYAALRGALVAAQAGRVLPLAWAMHKIAAVGALLAAGFYLALAGAEVATLRAFVMVAVMLVAILADRRAISLRTVAVAALVILAVTPEALVQPGFQMSFAATVALVVVSGPWTALTSGWHWTIRTPAMLITSSLIAGLATAPFAAAHFGRATSYGLLANLLAVPVMGSVVMPAGVIAGVLAPIGLAGPALWIMGVGTRWMLMVAEWVAGLSGAVTVLPAPHPLSLPLIAAAGIVVALTLESGRAAWRAHVIAGFAALVGTGLWMTAHRPALLIAPEGGAVGLIGPEGRALSKSAGGFVAANWAEGDGDSTLLPVMAARPGWSGPANARRALWAGRSVVHITGKSAAERALVSCADGAILVVSTRVKLPPEARTRCILYDQWRLRRTGAVAISQGQDGSLRAVSDADHSGRRAWTQRLRPWHLPDELAASRDTRLVTGPVTGVAVTHPGRDGPGGVAAPP